MRIQGTWSDARRLGRAEGRTEEAAQAVLAALRVRGIAVPDEARVRILGQKDPERLERWHEKAIVAASVEEVLGEPRRKHDAPSGAAKPAERSRARVEKPRRASRKTSAS